MKENDDSLGKLILDIESSTGQVVYKRLKNKTFELRTDPLLWLNLSGGVGAFFIRAILNMLNINEHHVFRWRLENKYWQYQIINYYIPNCIAETISLSTLLNEDNGIQKIRKLCDDGFFIKSTLGDSSGRTNTFDRTNELGDIINSQEWKHNHEEKWILQKKLDFSKEFRIHSFDKDVIYGLTSKMRGPESSDGFGAEKFLKEILDKLPDAILQGTLIGWDIGITKTNKYYVIEANITGFHPVHSRGFQTSGYFGDLYYGSIMCAWLNNYFKNKYQIYIDSVEDRLLSVFFKEFIFYISLFNNEHLEVYKNKLKGIYVSAIIYLGENIDPLLITLIGYFQEQRFAKAYHLIVNQKYSPMVGEIFSKNNLIKIITENTLFTNDQYVLIKELSYERRKKISCYHAVRIIKEKYYVMI